MSTGLGREDIRELLDDLSQELAARGARAELFLVGGAALAVAYDASRSTRDLDAVFVPSDVVPRALASPWVFTSATRYCPQCLAGDGSRIQQQHGGAWQKAWRLPVVFACPAHRQLLEHLCPSCRQPAMSVRMSSSPSAASGAPSPGTGGCTRPCSWKRAGRRTLMPRSPACGGSRTRISGWPAPGVDGGCRSWRQAARTRTPSERTGKPPHSAARQDAAARRPGPAPGGRGGSRSSRGCDRGRVRSGRGSGGRRLRREDLQYVTSIKLTSSTSSLTTCDLVSQPVPGPEPGRAVHCVLRRSAGRSRYRGRENTAPQSARERLCGKVRAHGPDGGH